MPIYEPYIVVTYVYIYTSGSIAFLGMHNRNERDEEGREVGRHGRFNLWALQKRVVCVYMSAGDKILCWSSSHNECCSLL